MSRHPIAELWDRAAGTHYQPRPGSYGVTQGQDGTVLVMKPQKIGEAAQLVFAGDKGYFAKHCVFFQATLGGATSDVGEADHTLIWLEPAKAVRYLRFESQQWAVAQTLG